MSEVRGFPNRGGRGKEAQPKSDRYTNVRRLTNKEITEFMEHILRMRHTPPDQRSNPQKVPL